MRAGNGGVSRRRGRLRLGDWCLGVCRRLGTIFDEILDLRFRNVLAADKVVVSNEVSSHVVNGRYTAIASY